MDSEDRDKQENIEKIKEASDKRESENSGLSDNLFDPGSFSTFLEKVSKGFGHWFKKILLDRKALPAYLIFGAIYISSFRRPNLLFREGKLNKQILEGNLQILISALNEHFVIGSTIKITTTLLLIGGIVSIYTFWLRNLKILKNTHKLLKKIIAVSAVIILLYRHIQQGSALERFSKWIIFLMSIYLELATTWFAIKTIDHLDLSSDLKNWSLRILGPVTVFTGSLISLASQPILMLSYQPGIYSNNIFLGGILVMITGGFMIYRSTRRQPALKVW